MAALAAAYPADAKSPNGKLRLLYEAAPMAFICEAAGGSASAGNRRILDIQPAKLHERTPLYVGSKDDVAVVERYSTERNFGEDFNAWLTRAGGADQLGSALAELDKFPTFDENADYYVDFGETGPYEANIGDSECAV